MKIFYTALLITSFLGCQSKQNNSENKMKEINSTNDPHSFAQPEMAVVTHLQLDLNVDFETKILSGSAQWEFNKKQDAREIIFDTDFLNIEKAVDQDNASMKFSLSERDAIKGSKLSVQLNGNTSSVKIFYRTTEKAEAVQWLSPEQTAGKKFPFLFTQSQAILARTWLPCQDSPGIRYTYDATIKVPSNLLALMSAENPKEKNDSGIYHFKMPQPVPSYLMALSVGDVEYHSYDERSGVYAEPVTLSKAAKELEDLPQMISAAENLYGKYAWGQYDVLILPPSFPFGGMENPRLTFATPTILAGDKSLTSLIAHELAHSWSGNLVTNATWNDFWMNEGFTVYFEYRIMEALYGKDFADMQKILGQQDLLETIAELGDTSNDTKLKLDLNGRNPDDGMTDIAYEKGNNFLLVIEKAKGREALDKFLKNHFTSHAFKTISTEDFLKELNADLFSNDSAQISFIGENEWVYQTGLPKNMVSVQSSKLEAVQRQLKNYLDAKDISALKTNDWSAFEWMYFLRGLNNNISATEMKMLDEKFHFTNSGNNEILFLWLELSIQNNYSATTETLENFLMNVGRRKFVKPLYAAMIKTPEGKIKAAELFAKAKKNYHSVTSNTISEMLQ